MQNLVFFGISNTHERTHLIRAIYEGVVFSAAMHIEKLMKFKSESLKSIRISGGAAKSKEWVQIYADTLQLPIEVSDAKELGTMGVAMTAAVGVGAVASFEEAIKKFVRIKYVCKPNPEKKEIYQKKYMLYKKLLSNMDNLWSEWNEFIAKTRHEVKDELKSGRKNSNSNRGRLGCWQRPMFGTGKRRALMLWLTIL